MNEIWLSVGLLTFGMSICGNIFLTIYIKKLLSKKPEATYDAKALMADLCTGPGLLKIEYVDRGDFFLRSPRDSQ